MNNNIIPFYISTDKVLESSKGCYQYDSTGKRYIDFESGVWCANIGHSHERFVKLLKEQADKSLHMGYRFRNQYAEQLSEELANLTGLNGGASVFLSTGSEAVNLSITLAQHLTGRKKILKISNSYLSAYGFGRIAADNDTVVTVEYNNLDSIKDIDLSEIAAFVVEVGGASIDVVKFPDANFLNQVVKIAKDGGCLIIAEEVTTCMGRRGKWFGYQCYDFLPDMVVTGKALGNGYPISALTVSHALNQQFLQQPFRYAQSHQNDPLGCALGLEVIKIIREEQLIEKSRGTSLYFNEQLNKLKNKYPNKVKDVRGDGLMYALEFQPSVDGDSVSNQLFEAGFVVGYKLNILRFMPPLTITNGDIDELINTLENILCA